MEQSTRQPSFQSFGRPQCLPPLLDLWGALEKEARYYSWRSGIKSCLQSQDRRTLKHLMKEVVSEVVSTKLPSWGKNASSFYGSPEVTKAAEHLSKDLALIFDTTLEEPNFDTGLGQPEPQMDDSIMEEEMSDTAGRHASGQWFMEVMGALTRATIDSGASDPLASVRYLGCSRSSSRGMEDILAPLLGLLQLSCNPHSEKPQLLSHPGLENWDIHGPAHETMGLPDTTQKQPNQKRSVLVSEDAESARKRMKRFPQSNNFPEKCLVENCELEWNVNGRNSLIEHIEAHTHPYRCTISQQCSLTFSRISNLNRHRETKHGSLVVGKQKLKTEDVLEMGGIHHRIRRFESLTQLRRLLEALGFTCCDS